MTSEKRAQKFHTDNLVVTHIWEVLLVGRAGKFTSTNREHYLCLGSDTSSVWNFCACSLDVSSRRNQWWPLAKCRLYSQVEIVVSKIRQEKRHGTHFSYLPTHVRRYVSHYYSGAPQLTKCGNLPIRDNLVILWPYTDRPTARPTIRPHHRVTNVYSHTF